MSGAALGAEQREAIAFFGTVTAGLSHELKNVLATINELSGLQEDLLMAARRGRPVGDDRLQAIGEKVRAQVKRGEALLGALNRFAHSVDHPLVAVDPGELLSVSVALCQRVARLKRAELVIQGAGGEGAMTVSPFAFHRLIIRAVEALLDGAAPGEAVGVELRRTPRGCLVVIGGVAHDPGGTPPQLDEAARGAGAGVALAADGDRRWLEVTIPDRGQAGVGQ